MVGRGIGGDTGAAERRLAEALGAQASLTAAPPAPRTPAGATRAPHPVDPRRAAPTRLDPPRPRPAPSGTAAVPRPGRRAADSAVRLRRALLVALLAGVLLGCALALLSVFVPGALPALG